VLKVFIYSLFVFTSFTAVTQDSIRKINWKDKISINGYIKNLNSANFIDLDSIYTNNFFHNRVNFKAYPIKKITIGLEVRNRLFYGETIAKNPFFSNQIGYDKGIIDMSFVVVDKNSFVLHSQIDRAYVNYATDKWDVRIGRQRINWGINMAWNPNDLFNAYNLIDFDYQERPGSDAIRVQYYPSLLSRLEVAIKPEDSLDKSVIAGLYRFNKWKYDFQVLGANYYTDIALGGGWAGNIKDIGFKGEGTYFHPKENLSDTSGGFSMSATIDYTFKKGIYINASYLLNTLGTSSSNIFTMQNLSSSNLSAKMLMPAKHTFFIQASGSINPATNASISVIYLEGMNLSFLMPSIGYSIKDNWDLSLVGQMYFGEIQSSFKNLGNSVFLRVTANF